MTAVMTFARSASGVRVVITAISGALTSGPKNDDSASAAITPQDREVERESEDRQREQEEATSRRAGAARSGRRASPRRGCPTTAPMPNAAKNGARDA